MDPFYLPTADLQCNNENVVVRNTNELVLRLYNPWVANFGKLEENQFQIQSLQSKFTKFTWSHATKVLYYEPSSVRIYENYRRNERWSLHKLGVVQALHFHSNWTPAAWFSGLEKMKHVSFEKKNFFKLFQMKNKPKK